MTDRTVELVGKIGLILGLVGSTVGTWCRRDGGAIEGTELLGQVGMAGRMLELVGGTVGASCRQGGVGAGVLSSSL